MLLLYINPNLRLPSPIDVIFYFRHNNEAYIISKVGIEFLKSGRIFDCFVVKIRGIVISTRTGLQYVIPSINTIMLG